MNLRSDVGFKAVFADRNNKDILIGVLNQILPPEARIEDIKEYSDREQQQDVIYGKKTVLDLVCVDKDDRTFIVEMQASEEDSFFERCVYYASGLYHLELSEGDLYGKLHPVYVVSFLNYRLRHDDESLWDTDHFISNWRFTEKRTGMVADQTISVIFVEMTLFTKTLEECVTESDRLFYIFRNSGGFQKIPEWIEEVERDFNHPAIIGWCPLNETWDYDGRKQFDDALALIYKTTKALDKTRPCIDTSGNFHVITDIFDLHDYEQDPKVFKEHFDMLMTEGKLYDNHERRQKYPGGPTFISEYGGIRWSVNENEQNAWGYGNAPKNKYEFIERYKGLTDALLDNDRMFGFCYTQLYDVEQEQNGLYTYSRKPKFETSIFRAINSRKAKIEL